MADNDDSDNDNEQTDSMNNKDKDNQEVDEMPYALTGHPPSHTLSQRSTYTHTHTHTSSCLLLALPPTTNIKQVPLRLTSWWMLRTASPTRYRLLPDRPTDPPRPCPDIHTPHPPTHIPVTTHLSPFCWPGSLSSVFRLLSFRPGVHHRRVRAVRHASGRLRGRRRAGRPHHALHQRPHPGRRRQTHHAGSRPYPVASLPLQFHLPNKLIMPVLYA